MEFLLLIVVAGLYYIIYLTAVMYSEKIVVLPIIIYAILFVIIGITFMHGWLLEIFGTDHYY